jgi:hypothetical protein
MRTHSLAGTGAGKRPAVPVVAACQVAGPAQPDPTNVLIAPPTFLRLPRLKGVRTQYAVSQGVQLAMGPLEGLVEMGYVKEEHIAGSKDLVEVLEKAIHASLADVWPAGEGFEIHINLVGARAHQRTKGMDFLVFTWRNYQFHYIPLETIRLALEGAPARDRLLATFYWLLDKTCSLLMFTYGWDEAKMSWERHLEYMEEQKEEYEAMSEADKKQYEPPQIDMEDPNDVPSYVKNSEKLRYNLSECKARFARIPDVNCRSVFETLLDAYNLGKSAKLMPTPKELQGPTEDALYHDGGDCPIGMGIGIDREDAVTAWMDQYANDLYQAGCDAAPWIVRGYRTDDVDAWVGLFKTLRQYCQIIGMLNGLCMNIGEMKDGNRN